MQTATKRDLVDLLEFWQAHGKNYRIMITRNGGMLDADDWTIELLSISGAGIMLDPVARGYGPTFLAAWNSMQADRLQAGLK